MHHSLPTIIALHVLGCKALSYCERYCKKQVNRLSQRIFEELIVKPAVEAIPRLLVEVAAGFFKTIGEAVLIGLLESARPAQPMARRPA